MLDFQKFLADPIGLEPIFLCSVDRCLIQLGHGSTIILYRIFHYESIWKNYNFLWFTFERHWQSESVLKIELLASRFWHGSSRPFGKFKVHFHFEGSFENENPTAVGGWKVATPKGVDHDEQSFVRSTMIGSLTYSVADGATFFKSSQTYCLRLHRWILSPIVCVAWAVLSCRINHRCTSL